jgi:hypothetical protein
LGKASFWVYGLRVLSSWLKEFREAEQRFLVLFLEKEQTRGQLVFLGASPQTPWVGFADFG